MQALWFSARSLALSSSMVVAMSCASTPEPAPAPAPDAAPAAAPAAAPVAPTPVEISVTSASPEAIEIFKKARYMAENYQAPQSIAVFQQAIALDANFAQAHGYLGAVSPNPQGLASVEKAMTLAAALPEAERVLIESWLAEKQGEQAKLVAAEKRLGELAPNDWRVQLSLGRRAQSEGRFDDAAARYAQASVLGPKEGLVHCMLGYLHLERHQVEPAVKAFEKYVELAPKEGNAYDSLADAYLTAGRLPDAEATYLKAIATDPSFFLTWSGVAVARALQGNFVGAEEAMAQQRKGAPSADEEYPAAVFGAWMRFAAGKDADAAKALDDVHKMVKTKKLSTPAASILIEKAELLNYMGKPKDALKKLAEAMTVVEKNKIAGNSLLRVRVYALLVRARAHADLAQKEEAAKALAEYTELAKSFSDDVRMQAQLHYFKGEAAWAAGDMKAAAAELAQCYEDNSYCLWRAVQALEKTGDKVGAAATTAKLVETPRRDSTYIFVRSKLGTIAKPK